jgi:hypothetical protein
MNLEFSGQILRRSSDIKFHQNFTSGSRVVPRARTNGRKDMRMLIAFCNFTNMPNKPVTCPYSELKRSSPYNKS